MPINTQLETIREKTSPKDVFLHLLAIVMLYASAASFITLLFQYINLFVPDALSGGGYYELVSVRGTMRFAIAALVIVFPVYLGTMWYLDKGYAINPSKRNLRIRKWLIYFTLFATALIIIGDLVSLIYNFLGGEIKTRFVLKVLSILFVMASIFYYYFWDVRRYHTE